ELLHLLLRKPLHLVEAEPEGAWFVRAGRLQRAIPPTEIDVDGAHLDAVLARVAHELRRRIESHRLAVEKRSGEDLGMEPLDPRRGIDQQRETGGVAFRKSVFAETFDLPKAALGEILFV